MPNDTYVTNRIGDDRIAINMSFSAHFACVYREVFPLVAGESPDLIRILQAFPGIAWMLFCLQNKIGYDFIRLGVAGPKNMRYVGKKVFRF
jgi:hypothetical protein